MDAGIYSLNFQLSIGTIRSRGFNWARSLRPTTHGPPEVESSNARRLPYTTDSSSRAAGVDRLVARSSLEQILRRRRSSAAGGGRRRQQGAVSQQQQEQQPQEQQQQQQQQQQQRRGSQHKGNDKGAGAALQSSDGSGVGDERGYPTWGRCVREL